MQQLRETLIDNDADTFRRLFDDQGYLLLRGLVDVKPVDRLAAAVTTILEQQDLLVGGAGAVERFRATRTSFYTSVQRLETFHSLAYDTSLQRVVRALVGDDAFVHPRRLLRALLPNVAEFTTPPHQDYPYIRGSDRTVTTWVPLRACRGGEGALRILAGSHTGEVLPLIASSTVAGSRVDVDDDDPAWASTDFEPGDVLVFHCRTVHAATLNTSGRVRISADYRHQSASEPVIAASLKPSGYPGVPDWPELLADVSWPSERWLFVPPDVTIESTGPRAVEET